VTSSRRTAGVVAAAGTGARFREAAGGSHLPKTFLPLAGRPIWCHAATALAACEDVEEVVVVVPPEFVGGAEEAACALPKVRHIVPGGERRQDSVLSALRALAAVPPEFVAVHDGARPLASSELVRRCIASAWERGSGVAAVPVTDTLKRASTEGQVVETVDRSGLWAMQTPQVFGFPKLLAAHEAAQANGEEATDDAALVERLGERVWLVMGEETNLKVTRPADLQMAEAILTHRDGGAEVRVGHGFDVHRFHPSRACILGGVRVPHSQGLAGHSDADVVVHAIMDAVLGALALGDIGRHFPDTDPAYAGVSSLELARRVAALAAERGYTVANIDATVIAEAPRIAPHADAMRQCIAEAFGCAADGVSVKGTTTEGLGFTGRGEGIATHAVAVLRGAL
jgi:2-C-methyl-D-erythritol 4-phosphate cytidylyltransferase / 2-C-methyl-D-erythritol 2,4-cyclodiphosphate synthase